MGTATISGKITYPLVSGGPDTSILLGSPSVTPASSEGAQISFGEGGTQTLIASSGSPVTLPMGTVEVGSLLYVGSNQPVTLKLNGGTENISISAGGFILLSQCEVTSAVIEATGSQATITYAILGD